MHALPRTAVAVALIATLAGCQSTATDPASGTGTAEAIATPAECAISGSPWMLDTDALFGGITEYLVTQGAAIDGGSASGSYEIDLARNGVITIDSAGVSVVTRWATSDGISTYTDDSSAGTSTASWAETDESGTTIELTGWSSDIVADARWDRTPRDGSANGIQYPFWELTGNVDLVITCSEDALTLQLGTSPNPFDPVFRH